MLLTEEKSICSKNQRIVTSKDDGESRIHRAINPDARFDLRHYKLDGDIFTQSKCCDFLLINDTRKKAYFIELKGSQVDKAIDQLEAGEQKCRSELIGYQLFYRIVCSKAKTHQIQNTKFRRFKEKHVNCFQMKENYMEEVLS